jgi:hypothetical protein
MLQHPNADALAWRLHDLLVGASRSASLGQADGETPQLCASHYYDDAARELASLLVHNLSVAASSKEPRDEDRFKPRDDGEDDEEDEDREEAGDSAEDDDGAKAPSLSLVNHPTWEGIVRAIFDDVERLVDVREVAATGGMRSVRRERRERARLSSPTEYEEWSKKQIADGRVDSDDDDDDETTTIPRCPPRTTTRCAAEGSEPPWAPCSRRWSPTARAPNCWPWTADCFSRGCSERAPGSYPRGTATRAWTRWA